MKSNSPARGPGPAARVAISVAILGSLAFANVAAAERAGAARRTSTPAATRAPAPRSNSSLASAIQRTLARIPLEQRRARQEDWKAKDAAAERLANRVLRTVNEKLRTRRFGHSAEHLKVHIELKYGEAVNALKPFLKPGNDRLSQTAIEEALRSALPEGMTADYYSEHGFFVVYVPKPAGFSREGLGDVEDGPRGSRRRGPLPTPLPGRGWGAQ